MTTSLFCTINKAVLDMKTMNIDTLSDLATLAMVM
jgi:hypothetical protein